MVELLDFAVWPLPPDDGGAGGQATSQADGSCSPEGSNEYPNCAKAYFNKLGIQTEIVKLNGSIELGPIVGLSEMIVVYSRNRAHPERK